MPRRAALVTQADMARAIRAAKAAGGGRVIVRRDGAIEIVTTGAGSNEWRDEDHSRKRREIVL